MQLAKRIFPPLKLLRELTSYNSCNYVNGSPAKQQMLFSVFRKFNFWNQLTLYRFYAKGKEKSKLKGKPSVEIREDVMAEAINVKSMRRELDEGIDNLKEVYIKTLSLRSATGAIETIPVKFEGQDYTIQDLAQISRKNPKMVILNMAIFPQTIPTVMEALKNSEMNLNPQQDSTTICIPIPKTTKEHRETLAKNAKAQMEKFKEFARDVQCRYLRKVENKELEGLSKEKSRLIKSMVMAVINEYMQLVESMKNDKQAELLREDK